MDGHEVYAGKRVAELKVQFLQHEYTWSDHCITGNKLGWGITASSVPASRGILREVEKLAADTEPDRKEGIPVEELIYSPVTGFTRMCTLPLEQGEDRRNNKLVKVLQTEDPGEMDPSLYLAGIGSAFTPGPERKGQLPNKILTSIMEDPDHILKEMGLDDILPVFLRAVFWTLLEYPGSLNFVAPDWDRKDFAAKAGMLMYTIHRMLPESLRPKAGYRSYAWKENKGTAFYFSKEAYGKACFELNRYYETSKGSGSDQLADYCFNTLASYWRKNPDLYYQLMEEISAYLKDHSGKGMELGKIQWIVYDFARGKEQLSLPDTFLLQNLPELMYWGSKEEKLAEIAKRTIDDIHKKDLSPDQESLYIKVLLEKVSTRILPDVCRELEYILEKKARKRSGEAEDLLRQIKEKNEIIYQGIKDDFSEKEEWNDIFSLIDGNDPVDKPFSSGQEDSEKPPAFLQNALKRRGEDGQLLDEEQVLEKERSRDLELSPADPGSGPVSEDDSIKEQEEDYPASRKIGERAIKTEANYRVLSSEEGSEGKNGNSREFLLTSLSTGFLTGCVIFMSHYSLMIGHWKIAVGMAGMWLILILNYAWLQKKIQPARPLWMGIGLCLVTGELIAIGADYFIRQEFRIYYFLILGAIAAGIQLIRVVQELLKARRIVRSEKDQNEAGRD